MDGKKVNPPIVVFNFRQQGAFDYNTTTEMVLKIDDPVAKEYMDAFHNGKEFEFEISIKPLC